VEAIVDASDYEAAVIPWLRSRVLLDLVAEVQLQQGDVQ